MTYHDAFILPGTCIHTLAPPAKLDFFDTQTVTLPRPITPLEAWRLIAARPIPLLKLAFRVRDMISSRFGVKQIGGFSTNVPDAVNVGDMLDFFLVEHVSDNVLTLSERDRHLDVLTCVSSQSHELTITSSVRTHNTFGRAYMIPVAPAHKLLVRAMLRRLRKELEAR
ncbi:MAG: DUF2867 domain-containing protein [Aliishimia sp.]